MAGRISPEIAYLPATSMLASADASATLSNLHERLWNRAYEELKESDPKVVEVYETVLRGLVNTSSGPLGSTEGHNGNASGTRCQQLQQLVRSGLDRTWREAAMKRGFENSLQVVQTLHELVEKALRTAPQVAFAWLGISIGLEVKRDPGFRHECGISLLTTYRY